MKLPGYLRLAGKISLKSSGEYRLGAVVARGGRVLSRGYNKYDTISFLARRYFGYQTVHAEMDALRILDRKMIRGSTLYVFRTRKDGSIGNSKPCSRCTKALRALGVYQVVYTITEFPYYNTEKLVY